MVHLSGPRQSARNLLNRCVTEQTGPTVHRVLLAAGVHKPRVPGEEMNAGMPHSSLTNRLRAFKLRCGLGFESLALRPHARVPRSIFVVHCALSSSMFH